MIHIAQAQGRTPVTVFRLQDRITLGNFNEVERIAREEYDKGMRDLIVDLSDTQALTSIGVRALIVMHRMLSAEHGRHLAIACATPEIRDMLDISGVTQYISIYDTVEDAVKSF